MKQTFIHSIVNRLKIQFERLDAYLERKAKLKEPLKLPATMTAEDAIDFMWKRYFGDECVLDTGSSEQAYPMMIDRFCKLIDRS